MSLSQMQKSELRSLPGLSISTIDTVIGILEELSGGPITIEGSGSAFQASIVGAAFAADRTYTLPDAGAAASFVMTEGTQTINGAKTFSALVTNGPATFGDAITLSSGTTITIADNVAASVAFTITGGGNTLLTIVTTDSAEAVLVGPFGSTPPANQTLTNSATITLPTGLVKVVDNGGAVTGIIMTVGTFDGQVVIIANAAAASVTFAAAGTSNVAAGTSAVIAANGAMMLVWDSGTSRWYDVH